MRGCLTRAVALQQEGRLEEVEEIYSGIIAIHPGQINALHFLGNPEFDRAYNAAVARLVDSVCLRCNDGE